MCLCVYNWSYSHWRLFLFVFQSSGALGSHIAYNCCLEYHWSRVLLLIHLHQLTVDIFIVKRWQVEHEAKIFKLWSYFALQLKHLSSDFDCVIFTNQFNIWCWGYFRCVSWFLVKKWYSALYLQMFIKSRIQRTE